MKKLFLLATMLVVMSGITFAQMPDHSYGKYSVYTNVKENSYGELKGDCITVVFKDGEAIIMILGTVRWNPDISFMRDRAYKEDGKNIKRWARGENMVGENCDWWTLKYESSKSTSSYAVYSLYMSHMGHNAYFYFSKDGKKLIMEPERDFITGTDPEHNIYKRVTDESILYKNNGSNNGAQNKLKRGNSDGTIYE